MPIKPIKVITPKRKNIAKRILAAILTIIIVWAAIVSSFILYIKLNPLDITWLVKDLQNKNIITKNLNVESVYLGYKQSIVMIAKNVSVKNKKTEIYIDKGFIRIAKASFVRLSLIIKEIETENLELVINATDLKGQKNFNLSDTLDNITGSTILSKTKAIKINNSNVTLNLAEGTKKIKNINVSYVNTYNSFNLNANGMLEVDDKLTPVNLKTYIPEGSNQIKVEATAKDIYIENIIKNFIKTSDFKISGIGCLNLYADISRRHKLEAVYGAVKLRNGSIKVKPYNKPLAFKKIISGFTIDTSGDKITFKEGTIIDSSDFKFNFEGDFSLKKDIPTLNIAVKNNKISFKEVKKYIPDLDFKDWINKNIIDANLSNSVFEFHGPLNTTILDGEKSNPYMNIHTNFENLSTTFFEGFKPITEAKGTFTLLKDDININIDSAKLSKQYIKRGSVNISPLFSTEDLPNITIKALASGYLGDVLKQLNNKFNISAGYPNIMEFKGSHDSQATIILYLENIIRKKSDNLKDYSLDIISDLHSVTGQDPIFKQSFQTSEAQITIKDDFFKLNANGFSNNQPFNVYLADSLTNFGRDTSIIAKASLENILVRDVFPIKGLNLSGVSDVKAVVAKKTPKIWNFEIEADVTKSLIKYNILDYTKALNVPGIIKAKGSANTETSNFDLNSFNINIDNFKASGFAKIKTNDFANSNINVTNIIIPNQTNVNIVQLKDKKLTIKGKSLRLNFVELFKDPSKKTNTNDSRKTTKKSKMKNINIILDQVTLTPDTSPFYDFKVNLDTSKLIKGQIKAKDSKKAQDLYIKLTPQANQTVIIDSLIPNFGNTIKKTIGYPNLHNGFGVLSGTLNYKNNEFVSSDLKLSVEKFQLLKAPILAQALASISLQQLLTKKEGILFDSLKTKLHYENSILKVNDLKVKGPSLGISLSGHINTEDDSIKFKGTLIPLVALNSLVGHIPVVGYILTGSQDAISGADFKVRGTLEDPKVSISPLSIVTPGLVKDIFSVF